MKKIVVMLAGCFLVAVGCNKSTNSENDLREDASQNPQERKCASNEVLEEQLNAARRSH